VSNAKATRAKTGPGAELVEERIAELGGLLGPIGLAERDIAELHLAAPRMAYAHVALPIEQRERERDLDEDGKQNGLDGHGACLVRRLCPR
jgi:hypothetical protein